MTEIKPTLDFMTAPVSPAQWRGRAPPPDFPIYVDELKEEVRGERLLVPCHT